MPSESIVPLPTPASAADLQMLAGLLTACVEHGASIGFVLPLASAEVEAYWAKVLAEAARGTRTILVAREHGTGRIVGTVQLAAETRANGRHRGEVQKLLVLPGARRSGLGSRLMAAIEAVAAERTLRLLYLDTSAGRGGAVAFYSKLGYSFAGGIPEYARDPDGTLDANAIFYKLLAR